MNRNHLLALLLLSATHALSACATGYPVLTYTAEPIAARVIDADTHQPLEGVIVVAHWELERGTVGGNVPAGQLMVMETTTDKDGKFAFPGWGPKTVSDSFLVDKDPRLLLFKSGYLYQALRNEYDSSIELRTRPVRHSRWHRKTIELNPSKGAVEEYAKHFSNLNRELDFIISRRLEDCDWKKIPRMIAAMMQQRQDLQQQGTRYVFSIDQRLSISSDYFTQKGGDKCGSPRDFMKGLQQ